MHRQTLENYLKNYLNVEAYQDYCPNGLQVEGKTEIKKIVTGVTASLALIEAAVLKKADALIVHHGIFWHQDPYPVVGYRKKRLQALINNDINLFVYHLPLDCHNEVGNNIQLANILGIDFEQTFEIGKTPNLGLVGCLKEGMTVEELSEHIHAKLLRKPLVIQAKNANSNTIKKIAWCTGAGQKYIEKLPQHIEIDAYLTGEISESSMHLAKELGVHFYSCGHHATERYGVRALGTHLAQAFEFEHCFIDIDNPA